MGMRQVQSQRVGYFDGHLSIANLRQTHSVSSSEVKRILVCRMEDEIHHGDETFHIIEFEEKFLLIGPFVEGGQGAVEALIKDNPGVPVEQRLVRSVPYRYRESAFLGLRLFPVPGLCFGPISDLRRFDLQERDHE